MPLLLVAGLTQWGEQWWEAGYQSKLAGFRLIAPDRLGHGSSDKPTDPSLYGEESIVEDLCAVLDDAGVERTVVWGFSLGAKNAASLATLRPDRVSCLVYGSGPNPARGSALDSKYLAMSELLATHDGLATFLRTVGVDDDRIAESIRRNPVPAALAAAIRGSRSYWADHRKIAVRSLWYVGEAEGGFETDELELANLLRIEHHVLAGAQHGPAFTNSDAACRLVVPFLQGCTDISR